MENPAPYACQIAAKPCARFCDNTECTSQPVAVPAPVKATHPPLAKNYLFGFGMRPQFWSVNSYLAADVENIVDDLLSETARLKAELAQARQQLAAREGELNRARWHTAAQDEELRYAESFMAEYLETDTYPDAKEGEATLGRIRRLLTASLRPPAL